MSGKYLSVPLSESFGLHWSSVQCCLCSRALFQALGQQQPQTPWTESPALLELMIWADHRSGSDFSSELQEMSRRDQGALCPPGIPVESPCWPIPPPSLQIEGLAVPGRGEGNPPGMGWGPRLAAEASSHGPQTYSSRSSRTPAQPRHSPAGGCSHGPVQLPSLPQPPSPSATARLMPHLPGRPFPAHEPCPPAPELLSEGPPCDWAHPHPQPQRITLGTVSVLLPRWTGVHP